MNYKLTIEYDGSRYDGWQRQTKTEQTIQGKIENVLSRRIGRFRYLAPGEQTAGYMPEGRLPMCI